MASNTFDSGGQLVSAASKLHDPQCTRSRHAVGDLAPIGGDPTTRNEEVPGIAIPVTFTRGVLRDVESNEILGRRGRYNAKGGVLIRALGISESNSPMFARSFCAPAEGEGGAAKRIGFTIIN